MIEGCIRKLESENDKLNRSPVDKGPPKIKPIAKHICFSMLTPPLIVQRSYPLMCLFMAHSDPYPKLSLA